MHACIQKNFCAPNKTNVHTAKTCHAIASKKYRLCVSVGTTRMTGLSALACLRAPPARRLVRCRMGDSRAPQEPRSWHVGGAVLRYINSLL